MVPGYNGLYMVSNRGRVKSLDRYVKHSSGEWQLKRGRILKPAKDRNGYLKVQLSKDGKGKLFFVHRLVAMAFIPNPNNLPMINHKDENPSNNCVDNLEWCTQKYNVNYGTAIERMRKKNINNEKTSKPVLQYTTDGKFVREWPSMKECGRNGYNIGDVCLCCRGKLNKHKGYIWKYKKED